MPGGHAPGTAERDLDDRPLVVVWEATRACALACRHCRASAQRRPAPDELTPAEARDLLAQIGRIRPPVFVITGGDPLERADLFERIAEAAAMGLRVSLAPSVTARLQRQTVASLAALGCAGIQLSLDGADAETHDRFRGCPGTFARTMRACGWVREEGIPLSLGTTVSTHNADQLDELYELVGSLGAARWDLFFLVPAGRAQAGEMIPPTLAEAVMIWLAAVSTDAPFAIKTTEAPQLRRVLAARRPDPNGRPAVGDGKGFVFIAANGDIRPSGFLPLVAGNTRRDDLLATYRRDPLFRALRDPDALTGPRCSQCGYRRTCGGSRSRAYAVYGDPLADDPLCAHVPPSPAPSASGGVPC